MTPKTSEQASADSRPDSSDPSPKRCLAMRSITTGPPNSTTPTAHGHQNDKIARLSGSGENEPMSGSTIHG